MKTMLADVRDAYRGRWGYIACTVAVAAFAVLHFATANWALGVVTAVIVVYMVVLRVTVHALEDAREGWGKTRRRLGDVDTMLTVETRRAEGEAYRADVAEEARTAARFDLIQTRADLDKAPTTGADIRHMCASFGQDVHEQLHRPDDGVRILRAALLAEEFREYMEAERVSDVVEIADALADMVVVIYGTAAAYGIDLDACCAEVYRSNMTKLTVDGDVVRNEAGKVLKPDTYQPPNLADVIGHMDGGPWSEQAAA